MLRFLRVDDTQLDTHTRAVGFFWTKDQLVAEVTTYRTHNKCKRRISMPSSGFESAIPAIERL